ncbi:hypothetical protein SmJEL517_g04040 [Synchytrium microbalum]|uniref:UBC core domain-containing protein n=1 Tax=Synchytrium microbalum TaxID=1806994 RepID=A0A507BZZ7_9FUNG|nr:uncharacterized protein SmJEL517_g04040 [Synchytrium microbalum]TPX33012.1 hypothetical protein SmJEL517_g04040 [Synchytrium microbalum]
MSRQGASAATALKRLMKEYKELTVNSPDGITAGPVSEDDFFIWEALIAGPDETPFEGGVLTATLTFPRDYPLSPPVMKFTCPIFHPNVYKDGTVCISILHAPEPNDESAANLDAAKMWREDRKEYERIVRRNVRASLGLD